MELYEGPYKPSKRRFKGMMAPDFKPRVGGIWTSPYDTKLGSDWIQWCLRGEFKGPEFNCWLLEPDPAANVLTFDDPADPRWHDLPMIVLSGHITYPAWELIARDYDGFHLTRRFIDYHRLAMPDFPAALTIYGWDCDSTFWFNWKFLSVTHLGRKAFPCP